MLPNVYTRVTISESVSVLVYSHGIDIYLGSSEISVAIEPLSLTIDNILTEQVDSCRFTIKRYGNYITEPTAGEEVRIYNNGEKIFGGVIVRITQRADYYKVILYDVECEDYTRLMDRRLVVGVFENVTANQIIESLTADYLPGFSTANLNLPTTNITYFSCNYLPVSQCIRELCDLVQGDWYVDYDRDIHAFAKLDGESAPFDIEDDNGTFKFDSLRIRTDITQKRNRVIIRGGEYLGDTFTADFQSDGVTNIYNLGHKYESIQVSVTGTVWDGGIDNVDPITLHDYLWNRDEKIIKIRGDRIPTTGSAIKVSGQPYYPVRVVQQDDASIADTLTAEGSIGDGIYEHLIIDQSINSREGARERAIAELESYKDSIAEADFTTYTNGLRAGMRIRVNSSSFGINSEYIINRVQTKMKNNRETEYSVSLMTVKTMGFIEFLRDMVLKNRKEIILNQEEIIDVIRAIPEYVNASESVTEQALNYKTSFVFGALSAPSGTKRIFITDGSPLHNDTHPYVIDGIVIGESVTVSIT